MQKFTEFKLEMKKFSKIKNILWDFDGVLVDSHKVRKEGFVQVLKDYPEDEIQQLLTYHEKNGGLSRYVKFRYFFEEIREESITEDKVNELSAEFSEIMKKKLTTKSILIEDTVDFVRANYGRFNMHIISGSDEKELQLLCKKLEIDDFFISIHGSPTPKIELVKEVMNNFGYDSSETVLIGDSINDYDASQESNISFYGYNNKSLNEKGAGYINSFR